MKHPTNIQQIPGSYLCRRKLVRAVQEPSEPGGKDRTRSRARRPSGGPQSDQDPGQAPRAFEKQQECLGNTVGTVPGRWARKERTKLKTISREATGQDVRGRDSPM